MARTLTVCCAVLLALAVSGCDEEFCTGSVEDPISAILVGLLCAGVDPPPENPPRAVFVTEPSVISTGDTVRFDASGSRDNGRIVKYEWDLNGIGIDGPSGRNSWDLDGNGSFETGPLFSPGMTQVYQTAGERLVRLRVADPLGRTSEAQRTVKVLDSRVAATVAAKRRGFAARLTRVRLPDTLPAPTVRGGVTTLRGLAIRGRLVAPARRLGPLRPFRRARWVARLNVKATNDESRLRGVALARFPRGRGKACLRITMATRERGRPAGRVLLLGGSGDAARLRGGGRFRFGFRDGAPRLDGRLRASLGRARPLPRACAGL